MDEKRLVWIWVQSCSQKISAMTTIIFIISEDHSMAVSTMINQGRKWILLELNQPRIVEWFQVYTIEVFFASHLLFLYKKDLNVKIIQFLFVLF